MIGKHLKQFTNSGINGSALCLLARPMQSHAGQKRFQLFVEKREKCKKIFLLLPTPLLQAGTKGGERAIAKALLYCRQKRLHLEGPAQLNVRDLAFKIAEARVMAFVS